MYTSEQWAMIPVDAYPIEIVREHDGVEETVSVVRTKEEAVLVVGDLIDAFSTYDTNPIIFSRKREA